MFAHTYFSTRLFNPLVLLERLCNRPGLGRTISFHGAELEVVWTRRAEHELKKRERPLIIEMQLYFSCVVKKRVLFHEKTADNSVPVTQGIAVQFRAVQASSCDPVEFARHYPVAQTLTSNAAMRMRPHRMELDFRRGQWCGEFAI